MTSDVDRFQTTDYDYAVQFSEDPGNGPASYLPEENRIPAVDLHSLSKTFGKVKALDGVTMDIPTGSVFGLLGPNGSGKTTLLSILCGFLKPSSGELRLFGGSVINGLPRVGAIVGEPSLWGHLSIWDNLRCARGIYNTSESGCELSDLLDTVGLEEADRSRRFRDCSTGMKQRLAIAVTLLGDPDILVLDEPTNGLDPQGIADIREMVRRLSRRGDGSSRTIIMASHLLNEVEQVCNHVGVLNRGRLLYCGHIDGLMMTPRYQIDTTDNRAAMEILKAQGWKVENSWNGLDVSMKDASPWKISEILAGNGLYLNLLQPIPGVESGFFELLSSTDS